MNSPDKQRLVISGLFILLPSLARGKRGKGADVWASSRSTACKHTERKKKTNYKDRENSPYNLGKGETLAQKSGESPPPRFYKKRMLMGIWRVTGSTRTQNLAVRSAIVLV
eukprot:1145025-Pelagomonas_calceolata.AAC.1